MRDLPNYLYQKGYNFEQRIKKYFEYEGWYVWRSSGSHSPADLICMRGGEVLLIQCKLHGAISKNEIIALQEIAKENNCQGKVVSKDAKGKLVFKEI